MPEVPYGRSNCWLTVILINPQEFGVDREAVRLALEKENIEFRPIWKPMHLQPVFKGCRIRGGAGSEDLFERIMPPLRNPNDRRRSQSSCYHHKKQPQTTENKIGLTLLTELFSPDYCQANHLYTQKICLSD